jgi:PAS domain S-box-containing protein
MSKASPATGPLAIQKGPLRPFDFLEPRVMLFVDPTGGLKRRYASQAAGCAAVAIAAAALAGLWMGLPLLSSWCAGFPPIRPVGALGLATLGLTLMHPGKCSRAALAIGSAVTAVAALVFVLVQSNVGRGLINLGLPPRSALEAASDRVTSAAVIAFGLAGASLALSCFKGYRLAAVVLGGLASIIAVFALLGNLAGINTLYGSMSVNSPPLPTTVGLLCIVAGIIFRMGAMPSLRKSQPLWRLQVMLGSAIVAPLLLFGAYAGYRIADAQLRQVREILTIEADTLSANIDREIAGEIERLQALAASPPLHRGDMAEFQRQAEATLGLPQSGSVVLIDRNMQQVVNTRVPFGQPLPQAAVPKPIATSFATGRPQVTGLFTGPVAAQLLIGIIVPVQIDGESRYVVGRTLGQRALERLIAANELPAGWHAVVSDAVHRVISRSEQETSVIGNELPPAQWRRPGPGGVFEFTDSEGRPALEASAVSELTGWETAVWAPKALLEAPVQALWRTLGVMALLAFALVAALASWLGRVIARSVGQAARAAVALGEGRPMPPRGTSVAEVDTLMAELHKAAARQQAAEAWRRQSEAIFRAMFDVSSVGKLEVEPRTARILRVNAAMCQFLGYSEAELLGKTALDITHPDDRDLTRKLGDGQATGESVAFDVEKRYVRKDGKTVWAQTTVNVILDGSGRPWRQTAVVQNITSRKEAEQELQASKDRLQLAFDAAGLGWWQYDPVRRIGSGDARFKEIFDLTADEISIDDIMKRFHPGDAERFCAECGAALDPADPKRSASEFRIVRKNGEVRWVEAHRLAHFEGVGLQRRVVSFGGTVRDITERKEGEEKEHLLMREINHRAKNMLSVVNAIAHQTASRSPEDFIERFSERIQALSANQDLLISNEWNGVEIKDLVCAQIAHFADLIDRRIALHGPDLRLNPPSAQAIGLALHELATNAGKYGALSTDTGRVDIAWGIDGDTLSMNWTEREGPPVSVPKRRGFGTIVTELMAERSMDGTVELDYAPSGLTWRLTCPAANALERAARRG